MVGGTSDKATRSENIYAQTNKNKRLNLLNDPRLLCLLCSVCCHIFLLLFESILPRYS